MKCSYCSPKYYGGKEAIYNATEIIHQLAQTPEIIGDKCQIVWGGGEPTLSPRFDEINKIATQLPQINKIRVLSNSLKLSSSLSDLLKNEKFHLVTSIDAGSQVKFKEIRGKGTLEAVYQNLQTYHSLMSDKRRLTIKYIITHNNFDSTELQSFVADVQKARLIDAMFQISCDFTVESARDQMIIAMYELAVRLFMIGAKIVFFDDLIRERVSITNKNADRVLIHLKDLNLNSDYVLNANSTKKIILWGSGLQASWYQNSTSSGRGGLIPHVVSNAKELVDLGLQPNDSEVFILPSGVQSTFEIISNINSSEFSSKIISLVVL
jgi:hypothetical protein